MFWFGFNKSLKYILPSAFSINYSIHLYFRGNSVHMFLIHLALTHQNIVSLSAIFYPKGFSSPLLLFFYFLETKRYNLPRANPSQVRKGLLNIAARALWIWKSSANVAWSTLPLSATLWVPWLLFPFDQVLCSHWPSTDVRFAITKVHRPADTLTLLLNPSLLINTFQSWSQ